MRTDGNSNFGPISTHTCLNLQPKDARLRRTYKGAVNRVYHPYNYGADKAAEIRHSTSRMGESTSPASPAASKKTEYEHKWHDSQRGKRWGVGRQRDRENMDALRAVFFNLFQFADIQTLMEGSRRAIFTFKSMHTLTFKFFPLLDSGDS